MPRAKDFDGAVFRNKSALFYSRVLARDGNPIAPSAVSTVTYSIWQLTNDPNAPTPVDGHQDVSLDKDDVFLAACQTDAIWTGLGGDEEGYNFFCELDVSEDPAFPLASEQYRVEFTVTPTVGQPFAIRFKVKSS